MKLKRLAIPIFIGPSLATLAVLALVPTLFAVYISLQNRELGQLEPQLVWFENFTRLFSDRRFLNSIRVSIVWEFVTVTSTMLVALLLGITMFHRCSPRMRQVMTLLCIIPVLLPRVSAAFVWKFAFHPLFGAATYPHRWLTGESVDLFASPVSALLTVAFVDVWQWGLFFAVIVLKLLETLPPQPFEAARVDRARPWEIYFFIAIPMLRGPLLSLTFVKMIESLRAFDLIYVMTRGGPGVSTETLDMYAFSQGFIEAGRISYASSMAVLMMVATTVAFTYLWKWSRQWDAAL